MKSFPRRVVFVFLVGIYLNLSSGVSFGDETIPPVYTVEDRVQQYGDIVASRLQPDFTKAGVEYPPAKMALVILKQERIVELYAGATASSYRYIRSYPIQAASGHLGPKLQQGDCQVPEGIYAVESLNPNSLFHLSLHVDYPNAFDRAQAQIDGRTQLGGDIMIHGSNVSIGCVAMGDTTAEDLFILAAKTGISNVALLFCPFDFRRNKMLLASVEPSTPAAKMYADLKQALKALPLPPSVVEYQQ